MRTESVRPERRGKALKGLKSTAMMKEVLKCERIPKLEDMIKRI
jgi:hypothetical protein